MPTSTEPRPNRRNRLFSLHGRIRLLTMSLAALAVAVSALAIYVVVEQSLRDQLADRVSRNADALLTGVDKGLPPTLYGFGVGNADGPAIKVAAVTSDGEFVTFTTESRPFTNSSGVLDKPEQSVVDGNAQDSLREVRGYMLAAKRTSAGETVMVAESLESNAPLLGKLTLALVTIGAFLVALAGIAGAAVARTGLRPVKRLRNATERVARTGDLEPIVVSGDDELASLATSYNEMLSALTISGARQNKLITDAGEELMEPLQTLRSKIDIVMALDAADPPVLSQAEQDELRAGVMTDMDVIIRLVHDLVDQAREMSPTAPEL
ncbi:HAMP domain-containing protein [Rhodococcus sp. G-MC3]|uniref:HAMP domain-containing protein n=1 Tax=Rhodococcus sp. G-MC3 TaxID=3046209 RepID=UPI0024BB41AB|nr:HAMP domain-containing protein [Rhodococcus sp. G-MC3]MDJ0392678.1 HAMP domain-containing protein [Rhodococcus sp. G-MC3]